MSDLISRADALAEFKDGRDVYDIMESIEELPSAEVEDRLYIKIYADDEPSVKAEKLYQICDETQSREVAEWLKEYFPFAELNPLCALADRECPFQGKEYVWCLTCPHISEEDRNLIKRAVEPKTGKWEEVEDYNGDIHYQCDQCGNEFILIDGTPKDNNYHFCPNCGADMRGEEK